MTTKNAPTARRMTVLERTSNRNNESGKLANMLIMVSTERGGAPSGDLVDLLVAHSCLRAGLLAIGEQVALCQAVPEKILMVWCES